jgi:hypothetical protein
LRGSAQNINNWFNTACFTDPAAGGLGDSSRSALFGPDFVNFDMSLFKTEQLWNEHTKLQFRAEAFNAFNHPQFGQPGTTLDSGNFGQIQYTINNPRLVQFALRITF